MALLGFSACDTGGDVAVTTAALRGKDHKVSVCHHAGKHGKIVIITVDRSALPAHFARHGDDYAADESGSCDRVADPCEGGTACNVVEGQEQVCCYPPRQCDYGPGGAAFCGGDGEE